MWIESMIGFMLLGGGQLALAEPHQALKKQVTLSFPLDIFRLSLSTKTSTNGRNCSPGNA